MTDPSALAATRYAPTGMVCSVDHLASAAGVRVLRLGGTAADAAIATNAVLAVTTQHMCGMGGDLFALVSTPGDGGPAALNASGRAGSGADPDALRAAGHTEMPFRGDVNSVPVPGCVDGWLALHERFGRLPLAEVLADAVRYATDGFPASPLLARAAPLVAGVPGNTDLPGDLRPGDVVRRAGVAEALVAVAEHGRDGFYGGAFGAGLVELAGGVLTAEDLARPQADWVAPLAIDAFGARLWTIPPNSQGYLTLAAAAVADAIGVPGDPDDPAWAHLLVEAAKQVGRDRIAVLHEHADGAALLADGRIAAARAAVDPDRAADIAAPTAPGGTIYLCAVDGDRMGVSFIQSNASGFGAHLVEPRTRIFLQNRGMGFSLVPGHPAEYGPGRRPPHTLSPALVTDAGGALRAVIGTMGGDSQPQVVLQLLARWLLAGQSPGAAVAAPRWALTGTRGRGFDTWEDPGGIGLHLESHAPAGWADGLVARGHRVTVAAALDHGFGHAHLIEVAGGGAVLAGAADPRALTGAAAGY